MRAAPTWLCVMARHGAWAAPAEEAPAERVAEEVGRAEPREENREIPSDPSGQQITLPAAGMHQGALQRAGRGMFKKTNIGQQNETRINSTTLLKVFRSQRLFFWKTKDCNDSLYSCCTMYYYQLVSHWSLIVCLLSPISWRRPGWHYEHRRETGATTGNMFSMAEWSHL